jgi:type I restriction enzyme M protein
VTALGEALIVRLRTLGSRYEATVAELDADIEQMGARVAAHLAAMGVKG